MIECCRYSYTSYTDLLNLTLYEFWQFRTGLFNVLEREHEAKSNH